jgi:hypothetical protein
MQTVAPIISLGSELLWKKVSASQTVYRPHLSQWAVLAASQSRNLDKKAHKREPTGRIGQEHTAEYHHSLYNTASSDRKDRDINPTDI